MNEVHELYYVTDDSDNVLTLCISHFPGIWPVLTNQTNQKASPWKKTNKYKSIGAVSEVYRLHLPSLRGCARHELCQSSI